MTRPCVLVPGILGTSLENIYPVRPETTWSLWEAAEVELAGGVDIPELRLTDDGEADAADHVVTRAGWLLPVAYMAVVRALRGRLGAPVYVFPYDWRLPTAVNARRLARFVRGLRRKPMTGVPGWDGTVDFVAHSLGGLIVRGFLEAWTALEGTPPPVGRVAFVATAHRGSLDAVDAMVRGETLFLGGRKELRKLARTFPSVYELLPTYAALVDGSGADLDVFDAASWQSNVATSPTDPLRPAHLARARAYLAGLPAPAGALCVFGNRPASTLRRLVAQDRGGERWFDFAGAERGDGDEVVTVESARLPGAPAVEIAWQDVSYFALKARHVSMHAFLLTLDEVQTMVCRWLTGLDGVALLPRGTPASRYFPP
jgi:hypothetical protein